MWRYIIKRLFWCIPTLLAVSVVSFVIIQLPPGDFLTSYIASLESQGYTLDESEIAALEQRYGLGEPIYTQYFKWISGIVHGDWGFSFSWKMPVSQLIWDRLGLTLVITVSTMMVTWIIAFPIGIYSAVRKYSFGDYVFTFLGFIGVTIPDFLLALILMVLSFLIFDQDVSGLFSRSYANANWSWPRVWDLVKHIWIPIVIVGLSGTAGLIRTMRANLLDEISKPYVVTARAKGQRERILIMRYPVRAALNPFISTVGWSLPRLVSGTTVVAVVLNLPTCGPLLLNALTSQDMYLAGSFILILSTLTVIGTLLSDLLLACVDPRIRYQ